MKWADLSVFIRFLCLFSIWPGERMELSLSYVHSSRNTLTPWDSHVYLAPYLLVSCIIYVLTQLAFRSQACQLLPATAAALDFSFIISVPSSHLCNITVCSSQVKARSSRLLVRLGAPGGHDWDRSQLRIKQTWVGLSRWKRRSWDRLYWLPFFGLVELVRSERSWKSWTHQLSHLLKHSQLLCSFH